MWVGVGVGVRNGPVGWVLDCRGVAVRVTVAVAVTVIRSRDGVDGLGSVESDGLGVRLSRPIACRRRGMGGTWTVLGEPWTGNSVRMSGGASCCHIQASIVGSSADQA